MTRKGAAIVIESMSLRVFEIQDIQARLLKEETTLIARIKELEQVQDPIEPSLIVNAAPIESRT